MADVVGTAFVRVKALTDKLGKDIEKSVTKGMGDAKLDKPAIEKGEDVGEKMGDGIASGTKKSLDKKAKSGDLIPDNLFEGIRRDIRKAGSKLSEDLDWGERIRRSIDLQSDDVRRSLSKLGSIGKDVDFDLPFFEEGEGKIKRTFDNIRGRLRENVQDFKKWRSSIESDSDGVGASIASLLGKFGSGGGGGFGRLGGRASIYGAIVGALVAVLPAIQDIGSAILAYATGLVAQIGFIVTALGGLGVAAAGALGSAFAAVGPIALAFKAETQALEEFGDSMQAAGEEFLKIGVATQVTLLPALDNAVFILEDLIPLFSEFGLFVGRAVGNFAELFAEVLTGEKAQGRFADILRSSLNILDDLLPTIISFGDLLSGIWVAAIPASERFAETLRTVVERWSGLVNDGLRTGALTETLNEWYDRAELLGSALGNLTGALFDILQVGADSSDNVFVRFDAWAKRYREFTSSEEGQNRLKLIFDNSLAVMRELNGVVADLFDGIFGRLDELGGADGMVEALQNFREILPDLQEGFQNFLGTVEGLTSVIGPAIIDKIRETFDKLKDPIGRLTFQILDLFEAIEESGAFETLLELLKILADTLRTLLSIPGFGTFVGYLLAFGTAAKVAAFTLKPFVALLGPFLAVMKGISAANVITSLTGTAAGMTAIGQAKVKQALADTSTGISSVVRSASVRGGGGVGGLLKGIVAPLGAMGPLGIAAGVGVAAVGYAFYKHKKDAAEFAQEVRQATEALGTINDGLNITAEGISNYVRESSRFESRNQIDDLNRMSVVIDELSESIIDGTENIVSFTDTALREGEISASLVSVSNGFQETTKDIGSSFEELRDEFNLTDEQLQKLAETGEVGLGDAQTIMLDGNTDLIDSFEELTKVLGKAAADSFDDFAANAQTLRLLGPRILNDTKAALNDAADDPTKQIQIMRGALDKLGDAAKEDTAKITGLSQATKDLAREQATQADGTVDFIRENQILRNEQAKLFEQVRKDFELFNSDEFAENFGDARREVLEFSEVMAGIDFEQFQSVGNFRGLDALQDVFPEVGSAASDLFDQLRQLPEAEFNAAARALNADADSLKQAMNGAQQAIIDLQEQALASLPSVQDAIDNSFKTEEDGGRFFDPESFEKAAQERIDEAGNFGTNLEKIQEKLGTDQARLALQQGPEAAANLAEALAVSGPRVEELLGKMEGAENDLSNKIDELFGDAVANEYLLKVKPVGDAIGLGLVAGLSSETVYTALQQEGNQIMDTLVRGLRGKFEVDGLEIEFVRTGKFIIPSRNNNTRQEFGGGSGFRFLSEGGFVPGAGNFFGGGPSGTDTVPAWLTPGEFVLRRSVAQSIPANILKSLNAGDPRLVRLLAAKNARSEGIQALTSPLGEGAGVGRGGAGGATFGQGSVVIYAQGTSASDVYREFNHRTNWKLTSRGDR